MFPTAIRQDRQRGHCTISQYPVAKGGGLSPHRGDRDARLVHLFEGDLSVPFVTFGGLQGANAAMTELLGPVARHLVLPAATPQNEPAYEAVS